MRAEKEAALQLQREKASGEYDIARQRMVSEVELERERMSIEAALQAQREGSSRVAHAAALDAAQAQADFAKALTRLTLIQDPQVPTP